MTKTQARAQAKKLIEEVLHLQELMQAVQGDVDDLISDVDETIDSIEPYGDASDLTEAQETRQEWFENLRDQLSELSDDYLNVDLEDKTSEIESVLDE